MAQDNRQISLTKFKKDPAKWVREADKGTIEIVDDKGTVRLTISDSRFLAKDI